MRMPIFVTLLFFCFSQIILLSIQTPPSQNLVARVITPYSPEELQRLTVALVNLYAPKPIPLRDDLIIRETLTFLVRGGNINDFEKIHGFTALHMALANKDIGFHIIKFLLDNGANVFASTAADETTLIIAGHFDRSPEIIKLLLDAGADPSYLDMRNHGALNYLLQSAYFHKINNESVAYERTRASITLLLDVLWNFKTHVEAYANATDSFQAMGAYGLNMPSTTLSWLALVGDVELLRQFLTYFGDIIQRIINQKINGRTALDWADNSEIARILHTYGAKKGIYVAEDTIYQSRLGLATTYPY